MVSKILDEYMKDFRERNPNFYVFNAVKHMDEAMPHIHLNYLPVASGYKKGMEVQNGHAKALEQMGYGNDKMSINKWRKDERAIIRDICKKYNFELAEEKKGRGKTFAPDEFKQMRDEAKNELRNDVGLVEELKGELSEEFKNELIVKNEDLMNLEQQMSKEVRQYSNELSKYVETTTTIIKDEMKRKLRLVRKSSSPYKHKDISSFVKDSNFQPVKGLLGGEIAYYKIAPSDLAKHLNKENEARYNLIEENKMLEMAARVSLPVKQEIPPVPKSPSKSKAEIKDLREENESLKGKNDVLRNSLENALDVKNRVPIHLKGVFEDALKGKNFNALQETPQLQQSKSTERKKSYDYDR
jgi:hypothetical protein